MNSFEICKAAWRKMLVGAPDDVKNGDEAVKKRVEACGNVAMKTWEALKAHKKGEETVALFRDTPITESIEMSREYETPRFLYALRTERFTLVT